MTGFSKSAFLLGLTGILTFLSCLCWIVLSVLSGALASLPLIAFGIRGFANLEDCAIGAVHSLDAFNFLSGLLFLIVIVALLLVMYFKTKHGLNNLKSDALSKSESVLYYLMFILLIISMIMGFCDIVYSFYIASQVFGQYDEFQEGQVNCSSSVYYSSFVSVVIVFNFTFVLFGIALFLCHQTLTCRRTVNSRSNTTG